MRPLFEIEGAKSKRPVEDDAFAFEPMNANVRAGELRRKPSTDEKKARRQQKIASRSDYDYLVLQVGDTWHWLAGPVKNWDSYAQAAPPEYADLEFMADQINGAEIIGGEWFDSLAGQIVDDRENFDIARYSSHTAGILDYYEVVVHWRGDEVGVGEAGYADQRDAVAKAEQFMADPQAFRVTVINTRDGKPVWANGDFVGGLVASRHTAAAGWYEFEPGSDVWVLRGNGQMAVIRGSGDAWAVSLSTTKGSPMNTTRQVDSVDSLEEAKALGEQLLDGTVTATRRTAAGEMKWNDYRDNSFDPGEHAWGLTYDSDNLHGEAIANGGGVIFPNEYHWTADAKARQGDMSRDYTARGTESSIDAAKRKAEEALLSFEQQQAATVIFDGQFESGPQNRPWHASLISQSASIHESAIVNHIKAGGA